MQADHWLEMQFKRLFLDRLGQVVFQCDTLFEPALDFRCKDPVPVFAFGLGFIEREVGQFQQSIDAAIVLREACDSNTDSESNLLLVEGEPGSLFIAVFL